MYFGRKFVFAMIRPFLRILYFLGVEEAVHFLLRQAQLRASEERRASGPRNLAGFMKLTSVAVVPSSTRSAAMAPSAVAILKPWPEKPAATTTPSMPGTVPSSPVASGK